MSRELLFSWLSVWVLFVQFRSCKVSLNPAVSDSGLSVISALSIYIQLCSGGLYHNLDPPPHM